MPSRTDLVAALARYPQSLVLRANASKSSADLVELDGWYRGALRETLKKREEEDKRGAFLEKEELVKLMRWKLARGKWRPRLQDLVAQNPPSEIESSTVKAFEIVDSDSAASLAILSKLKAVGPATAAAILACWRPEVEPFMSDEAMENAEAYGEGEAGSLSKKEYTVKAWQAYRKQMRDRLKQEKWASMEELEKALWSWAVERKYGQAPTNDEEKPIAGKKRKSERGAAEQSKKSKKASS
ncbi:hypothetical protein RTG_02788 [Rhodotorula toruloides ATCC 204091]|uniref:Uncharacterized protein n=1 Tax=Rhodotorula toruloides TaxID=5286 RepID=A0A0K3CBC0_RHOTO|nr:hypothetical protein RTG_02788 [Rhodotorula toruloides ATCC 204091]KAK4335684.1 hypothetical protein RTBOTA2_004438 [Rhodotorula toruloides]PRQ77635.1 hypothetical protein AAT19DRAFT_8703 [Rhodotorula toruloides]